MERSRRPAALPAAHRLVAGAGGAGLAARRRRGRRSSPTCGSRRTWSRASHSTTPPRVRLAGIAAPVLVTSTMGRPIKIEGNPEHPECLGATDAYTQAALLDLYDPDRSRTVTNLGSIRPYSDLLTVIRRRLRGAGGAARRGAAHPHGAVSSPTLLGQIAELLARFPQARWHQHEPVDDGNAREGARRAFGEVVETRTAPGERRRHPVARPRLPGAGPGPGASGPRVRAAAPRAGARRPIPPPRIR